MDARLAVVIMILVSAAIGMIALQASSPAVIQTSVPAVSPQVSYSGSTNVTENFTGFAGQVWNAIWLPISGIAIYFENIMEALFNNTVLWFTLVMQTWTSSVSGFGLWSFPFLVVILGVTFIGVSLTLAVGDAAKDVVEE